MVRASMGSVLASWLERQAHVPPSDALRTRNILVRDNSGTYLQLFEAKQSVAGRIH